MNIVAEIRNGAGLTQTELARRADVSRPNVVAYEHGRRDPTWPVLERLLQGAGYRIAFSGGRARLGTTTRETRRSRMFGVLIAAKLIARPEKTLAIARENLARLHREHEGGRSTAWLDKWERLLEGPLEEVIDVLVSTDPEAADLRQANPFAGILTDEERKRAVEATRR